MEIKIQCGCGSKYKFDVEPVNGRMPVPVQCPNCGTNGTTDANEILARHFSSSPQPVSPPAPAQPSGLRLSRPVERPSAHVQADGTQPGAQNYSHAPLLERTSFFVKEHVGLLKLTDTYDILDPVSGQMIGVAKEEPPSWAKWLRLIINKSLMPTNVNIYEHEGQPPVASIHRGFTFLRSKINVVTGDGRSLGYFKSKLFSLGGGFHVFDNQNQPVAEVKGNWKGWDFKFINKQGRVIGTVTKKWAGLGKELFTSADNYIISLTNLSGTRAETSALLLAAGLAIDVVFKEKK